MAYVIERESRSGRRYVGIYQAADGKYKSAGSPVGIDLSGILERKNAARRAWIASNVSGRT